MVMRVGLVEERHEITQEMLVVRELNLLKIPHLLQIQIFHSLEILEAEQDHLLVLLEEVEQEEQELLDQVLLMVIPHLLVVLDCNLLNLDHLPTMVVEGVLVVLLTEVKLLLVLMEQPILEQAEAATVVAIIKVMVALAWCLLSIQIKK
jgi:hypothetical protein